MGAVWNIDNRNDFLEIRSEESYFYSDISYISSKYR